MAQEPTYRYNVVYNHAMSSLSETPDTKLSLKFTEELTRRCEEQGITPSYYHDRDRVLGRYIFEEYSRVIKSSKFTILILTKGFLKDCFANYKQHTALKILLDEKRKDKLIPIVIGSETPVPYELAAFQCECFTDDVNSWSTRDSKKSWEKVLNCLTDQRVNMIHGQHSVHQESGDDVLRSEINNALIAQATKSYDESESYTSNQQMEERVAILGQNLPRQGATQQASLSGIPVTRPPDLNMAETNQSTDFHVTNQRSPQASNQSPDLQLTNQTSLIDSPVTRPPDLVMAPTNQSPDHLLTNQRLSQAANQSPDHLLTNQRLPQAENQSPDRQLTNQRSLQEGTPDAASGTGNSVIRQQSLSLDADIVTDQPLSRDRYPATPDSGFNPGLSGYSSDISGSLSTSIDISLTSASDSLSEISEIALNQNGNPISQVYASTTSSTCSETYPKRAFPVSGDDAINTVIKDDDAQAAKPKEMTANDKKMVSDRPNVKDVGPLHSEESKAETSLRSSVFAVLLCFTKPECAYNGMIH